MLSKRTPGVIRPYSTRPTQDLLYIAAVLTQRDMPLPVDLTSALNARGIEASSI